MTNDQLRAEHAAGASRPEIAIKYGMPVQTVYTRCRRLELKFPSYWPTLAALQDQIKDLEEVIAEQNQTIGRLTKELERTEEWAV